MKARSWLFLLLLLNWPTLLLGQVVKVAYVIDGDTFITTRHETIRLLGIDTPELAHGSQPEEPLARQAMEFTRDHVLGQEVTLTLGQEAQDRYGRTLAYVNLADGRDLEGLLLARGLALVMIYPPNLERTSHYLTVEAEARRQHRGLWQDGGGRFFNHHEAQQGHGRYGLVAGKIVALHEGKNKVYLNFGPNHNTDFTIIIPLATWQTLFYRQGWTPQTLTGRQVVARGKIFQRGGATMTLNHPLQLQPSP